MFNTDSKIYSDLKIKAASLGLRISDHNTNCNDSTYIEFENVYTNELAFIIRFSEHFYKSHNTIPAGVIAYCYDEEDVVDTLIEAYKTYRNLLIVELDSLWTNRLYEEEFCYFLN